MGAPHDRFGQQVIAFVEPSSGCELEVEELKVSLESRLAGYKVPRHLVIVDSIGRAANGKVDQTRWKVEAERVGSALS